MLNMNLMIKDNSPPLKKNRLSRGINEIYIRMDLIGPANGFQ